MTRVVTRKEDMSPVGFLKVIQQEDGDMILGVFECEDFEKITNFASVEFCTIGMGGGKSPKTLEALRNLAKAMAEDNKDYPLKQTDFDGKEFLDD